MPSAADRVDGVRVAIVAAALSLVACDAATSTTPPTSVTSAALPAGRIVELSVPSATVLRDIEVGPDPLLAVGAGDSIWTVNLDDSTVSRVDAGTGAVTRPDAGEVVGIAADGDDVWVASDRRELRRLDGTSGQVERSFALADRDLFGPRDAGFLVAGQGSIWLTVPAASGPGTAQELWRIDPATGQVLSEIPIGLDPLPPVVVDDAIWVPTPDLLYRVDMRTERVRGIEVGPFPGPVAGGAGRVWASAAGVITSLDPDTGKILSSIEHPDGVRGLLWLDDRLWIATARGVEVLDPKTGSVERTTDLAPSSDDEGPIVLVRLGSSVWVTIETA